LCGGVIGLPAIYTCATDALQVHVGTIVIVAQATETV